MTADELASVGLTRAELAAAIRRAKWRALRKRMASELPPSTKRKRKLLSEPELDLWFL